MRAVSEQVAGSYFSEIDAYAVLVASTNEPSAVPLGDVRTMDLHEFLNQMRSDQSLKAILSAGVPCQDVYLLSSLRKGAHGERSGLCEDFRRIYEQLKTEFGSRIKAIMECTPMDETDRAHYDAVFGQQPYEICTRHWQPITRRRWWFDFYL